LKTRISRKFEYEDFDEALNYYKKNMSKGKVLFIPMYEDYVPVYEEL
jgi:hypothetical protein